AGSAAVGINMTYMAPYMMLKRGWNRDYCRMAIFDLATGMMIPFVLATSFVVIAAAHQFHAAVPPGFEFNESSIVVPPRFQKEYNGMMERRAAALGDVGDAEPASGERRMAAVLVRR